MQKRTILKNIIVLILCFSLLFSVSAKQDKSNEISISLEYNKDSAYDADDNGEESLDGIVDLTVEKSKFSWKADENKVCTLWSIESLDDNRISKGCYGAENCCNFADLVSLKDSWKDDFYLNYGAFGATYNNIIHSQIMYVDYDINPNDAFAEIVSSDVEQLKANFQEPELGDNFRQCGETDVGVCEYGIQELKFDIWGKCLGSVDPDEEICDGLDNDCDGLTDEQLVQECGTDVGACVSGTQTCANGKWADCSGTYIGSSDEVCDGIDNDCDDEVDEGCECVNGVVRSCGSDIGECVSGTQKCAGGKWGQCKGSVASVSEECDGLDNDCDGFVDEDVTQECGEYHLGACKKGTQSCMTGEWGVCEGAVNPGFEICDNIDNDCDGKVDESLSRKCDGKGNQECSNGVWSQCKGEGKIIICHYPPGNPANKHTIEIDESAWPAHEEHGDTIGECDEEGCLPSLEICDGLDNDCDDEVDENLVRACGCDCAKTHILLVLDDNNNNEDIQDIDNLKSDFDALDIDYTFINEPTNGLTYDQIRNYDLVWFSNPGWPLDDINTLNALTQYVNEGNPVVMQGDDMTWAQGSATNNDMILFTGLKNINNGLDSDYTVTFGNDDHPLLNFLGGKSFTYKEDDIDTSTVYLDDVEVLASAVNKNDGSKKGPALVVRDLSEQGKGVIIVALLTFMEIEPRWHGTALTGNIVNWLLNKAGKCECGTDVGACTVSTQTCISGDWGVCEGIPPIHEICNGVDDDCNGKIDDGLICECHVGQTEICGTDTGQCKSGERTCLDGLWGECVGSINPIDEVCGDGRDNDCNNIIDENCCFDADGDTYLPASCGGDDCDDNNSLIHPGVEESCNSVDDDCDGFVDESLARICGDTDIGQCSFGLSTCFGGVWGACVGSIAASDEICNNIDDDCDGMIDEGLTQVCGSNIGQCVAGLQSCSSGIWGECIGSVDSSQEICDGLDNDCDGYFDDDISCTCLESETRACGSDVGECVLGVQACGDNQWGECVGYVEPTTELCDGLDNDCDGDVDENLARSCGSSDVGACKYGMQKCNLGSWSACDGAVNAVEEICDNNIDDDCNSYIDEGCLGLFFNTGGASSYVSQPTEYLSPAEGGVRTKVENVVVRAVNLPDSIDVSDNKYPLQIIIENKGTLEANDINIIAAVNDEWQIEQDFIGSLKPGEKKSRVLNIESKLCSGNKKEDVLNDKQIDVMIEAKGDTGIIDSDVITIPLNIPEFSMGIAENDYSKSDNLEACFFINNMGNEAREKLEIEFELYDQKSDIIIDLLTPVKVGKDEVVIKRREYTLNEPLQPKIYNTRTHLYEGGNLFSGSYVVGSDTSRVDLSELQQVDISFIEYLSRYIVSIFQKR